MTLERFAKEFPTEYSLWERIKASDIHISECEKKAVARSVVYDVLKSKISRYLNTYDFEVTRQYAGRPFAAYDTALLDDVQFGRKSVKRTKTVLGWVYSFLMEAGETELLLAFEVAIAQDLEFWLK